MRNLSRLLQSSLKTTPLVSYRHIWIVCHDQAVLLCFACLHLTYDTCKASVLLNTCNAQTKALACLYVSVRASVLYGIILYYIVLCCIILYYVVVYCIILYYIVVYCIILYYIVLYCIILHYIVLYCSVLYYIVLYCILLYYIVLYCINALCGRRLLPRRWAPPSCARTILYYDILYHIIYDILYYVTLCYVLWVYYYSTILLYNFFVTERDTTSHMIHDMH